MNILKAYFIFTIGIMLANTLCVSNDLVLKELPNVKIQEEPEFIINDKSKRIDIFVEAEKITGCSAEILRGIASTESDFTVTAVGDGGQSHGMFQLHNRWHDSRVEKYGEFDSFDPADAAIIAGYIIQENLQIFNGNLRLAIAAYRQGVTGVIQNGCGDWYVDEVIFWRSDKKKVLAFLGFQGITVPEEVEYEHIGFGTQIAYKLDDTPTLQISRRRSSGF